MKICLECGSFLYIVSLLLCVASRLRSYRCGIASSVSDQHEKEREPGQAGSSSSSSPPVFRHWERQCDSAGCSKKILEKNCLVTDLTRLSPSIQNVAAALGSDWTSFLDDFILFTMSTNIRSLLGLASHAWGGVGHSSNPKWPRF